MRKSGSDAGVDAVDWKLVVAGMATLLLAGCSDSVERFSGNYSNPSDADPVYTASIPKYKPKYRAPAYQAPAYQSSQNDDSDNIVQSPVASAPVAKAPSYDYTQAYSKTYRQPQVIAQTPVQTAPAYPPPKYTYNTAPAAPAYQRPAYKPPVIVDEKVADAEQAPAPIKRISGGRVTVGEGVTLYSIAKANHMTVKQLAEANNIQAPYTVAPGRVILVPGVPAPVVPAVNLAAAQPIQQDQPMADAAPAPSNGSTYVVAKGDTLFSVGRKFSISPFAIADTNRLPHDKPLPLGKTLRIPVKNAAAAKQMQPAIQNDNQDEIAKSDIPQKKGAIVQQDNGDQIADDSVPVATPAAAPSDAQLAMRWPVRGKVISAFGPKSNGMKNEGINISVPEGTNVQAAEAGVIAYAGNELKGYGNLILIRHAGGYVTAYAHASQILVRKGDIVKRGDVIAKSGQTGAVQSPQLHFEVRKGATPLNPATFLNSATASN